jgi:C1A family cysteine protease
LIDEIDQNKFIKQHDHISSETNDNTLLDEIEQAIQNNNASWSASANPIYQEYLLTDSLPLGCNDEVETENQASYTLNVNDNTVPDSWDWRNVNGKNWMTSVRNQKGCGSCVAFGTLGAVEAVMQIELNRKLDYDLSESHLFFCGGGSCSSGWWVSQAVKYMESIGVPDEGCFPYVPVDQECQEICSDSDL